MYLYICKYVFVFINKYLTPGAVRRLNYLILFSHGHTDLIKYQYSLNHTKHKHNLI